MLRAARAFSLGEHHLKPGDTVTDEMLAELPARRFDVLVDQRFIERVSDEETIKELKDEIEKLKRGKANKRPEKAAA